MKKLPNRYHICPFLYEILLSKGTPGIIMHIFWKCVSSISMNMKITEAKNIQSLNVPFIIGRYNHSGTY